MSENHTAQEKTCPHPHERHNLHSRHFPNARIWIQSCPFCGWIDTEAAIEEALALADNPAPVSVPETQCAATFREHRCTLPSGHPYAHHSHDGQHDDFSWACDATLPGDAAPAQEELDIEAIKGALASNRRGITYRRYVKGRKDYLTARDDLAAAVAEVERLRAALNAPRTPSEAPQERMKQLAYDGAKLRHFGAIEREHDHADFSTCPHPDCKLVRSAEPTRTTETPE